MIRAFETITPLDFAQATNKHLDVQQALRHLSTGEETHLRIRCAVAQQKRKRHVLHVYADRLGIKVRTFCAHDGWIYVAFNGNKNNAGIQSKDGASSMSAQRAIKVTAVIFFPDEEEGCPGDETIRTAIHFGLMEQGYEAQEILITGHERAPEEETTHVNPN